MTLYDGGGAYSVSGGGGGCCSSLGRVALMFITVLSTTFTIGTLIIAGSALYNVYNRPEEYSVDHRGLVQLWLLVAASGLAVATNACGFVGALLRIRCLLLGYALVTGVVVGGHLLVTHLQRRAASRHPDLDQLQMDDDPQSVWTVEMNAYAAHVLKRVRSETSDNSTRSVERINKTVSELRAQLAPNATTVAESALRTVNTIHAAAKHGVDEFISQNITIPTSCCVDAAHCNATLRRRPRLDLEGARAMSHPQPCGQFLHAAHGFVVAVVTWVGYVVAGSQLCGVVIALLLALCCL
ncbi:hypothetical protein FJT64_016127 [Amphibalanus amphitrite]|uniref:Uncharacterized protein n=1 Tax=Amphibalanus amphitrite TaxID=1232801 RepID=A0A6A4X7A7_AMPAM|nr:hypothetical protein FJT64_016127 [Amphibalanus amphitrite]